MNVAVNDVLLVTLTPLTVMPAGVTVTFVESAAKFVPVKVTCVLVPLSPFAGEIDVSVGVAAETANWTELLSPPCGVETNTK